MKKLKKILAIALALATFSLSLCALLGSKAAPKPAETQAASNGYKVKVNFAVTDDADYWDEAYFLIYARTEQGRGGPEHIYTSENFYKSVEYTGANYTSGEVNCGTRFPYCIQIKTTLGAFWQYHYGEADIKIYINGINVAYRHIGYGGWNCETYYSNVDIDQTKYPYPIASKIKANYSENVDPDEESTQIVTLSAVDQYGVPWTTPASSPITVDNLSYPGEDTAERLDSYGFKWKLNSARNNNHYSTFRFNFGTASNVYPTVTKEITVQFAFPFHLNIVLNGVVVRRIAGYEGDIITLSSIETPVGYYISTFKKTSGVGTVEKDKETGIFRFTFTAGDATLTANAKAITYTIVFDPNGDGVKNKMGNKTMSYDSKSPFLPVNYYQRQSYKFLGWNTKADGSGIFIEDKGKCPNLTSVKGATVTLYAQWESLNPSVTASLFTDGSVGLIAGGAVFGAALIGFAVLMVLKSRKRKGQ